MKKSILSFMTAFLLVMAVPAFITANEIVNESETTLTLAEISAEVKTHIDRLSEIKAMDFSELSSSEKKELRTEVRSISKEMKALGKADSEARANADADSEGSQAGLYISGTAILVVLILLLLLR